MGDFVDGDGHGVKVPSTISDAICCGRDFSDVSPLRGVTLGEGNQKLIVAVDVSAEKS